MELFLQLTEIFKEMKRLKRSHVYRHHTLFFLNQNRKIGTTATRWHARSVKRICDDFGEVSHTPCARTPQGVCVLTGVRWNSPAGFASHYLWWWRNPPTTSFPPTSPLLLGLLLICYNEESDNLHGGMPIEWRRRRRRREIIACINIVNPFAPSISNCIFLLLVCNASISDSICVFLYYHTEIMGNDFA